MNKYTPGPWKISRSRMSSLHIVAPRSNNKLVVVMDAGIAGWLDNAPLIAAAPEMLEWLKRYHDHNVKNGLTDEKLEALINKAEGK